MARNPFESVPVPVESHEKKESFAYETLQLMGKRDEQQDVALVKQIETKQGSLLAVVVADGHGHAEERGENDGSLMAAMASKYILASIETDAEMSEEAMKRSFADAQKAIEGVKKHVGGTTATCVLFQDREALIGWVGNSETRVFSSSKNSRTLAEPHEFGMHPQETARLMESEALISDFHGRKVYKLSPTGGYIPKSGYVYHEGKSLEITRSLGDEDMEPFILHEPEIKRVTLEADDRFLVVATDGVWGELVVEFRERQIEKILCEAKDVHEAQQRLTEQLQEWKVRDNATAVVIEVPQEK